jgi:hypothetical protein
MRATIGQPARQVTAMIDAASSGDHGGAVAPPPPLPAELAALPWATHLGEVFGLLAVRKDLVLVMRALLANHEIPVKVTEGGDRRARRKAILEALFVGDLTIDAAVAETERRLARDDSPHAASNLVFASGWARRLIYTHTNVFYCWAVLEQLMMAGQTRVRVPHAASEAATSRCSRELAGRDHDAVALRDRLVQTYVEKRALRVPLVPNHPHCTHVVAPVMPATPQA